MSRRKIVVLDLGEDLSSVWSPARGLTSEGSRIAVDRDNRAVGFETDADLLAGRRQLGLQVTTPRRLQVADAGVASSFVRWLLARAGLSRLDGAAVFLPLPADMDQTARDMWCKVIVQLGGEPLVIHRSLAAALELDLWSDGRRAHLMIEVSESVVDIDVIAEGQVLAVRHVPRHDYEMAGKVVTEVLMGLDPDDELDIRDEGMNLYGHTARRDALAALSSIDLPLASTVGSGTTVLEGARLMARETVPWLTS